MIRALRPTDILAYVSFSRNALGPVGGGLAGEPDSHRSAPILLSFLGRSLALAPGRETWVQVDHGRIAGLVTTKRREGADVWDVDELTLLPAPDAGATCARLLQHMLAAAVEAGIQKIYLRVPEDDPTQDWARRAGFFHYASETWYSRSEVPTYAHPPAASSLRRRRPVDHQGLFQLYCSAVPFRVRQVEGMTLHEWRWTDGWATGPGGVRGFGRSSRVDFILDGEQRPRAWLQVERRHRRLSVLTDQPDAVDLAEILRFGMARLGPGQTAWCPVRDYQVGLATALEDAGFVAVRRIALLARGLAARLPELKLVPVRAS
jgi:hypothetical protein